TLGKRILTAAMLGSGSDTSASASSSKTIQATKSQKTKEETNSVEPAQPRSELSTTPVDQVTIDSIALTKFVSLVKSATKPLGIYLEPKAPSAHVNLEITFPLEVLASDGKVVNSSKVKTRDELSKILKSML